MYTAKSRCKDPDRYIDRLKEEAIEAWARVRSLRDALAEAQGRRWFGYGEGNKLAVTFKHQGPQIAQQAHIGQKIILHGEIIELKKEGNKFSAEMALGEVRLIG